MRRATLPAISATIASALLLPLTASAAHAGPPGIPTVQIALDELAAIAIEDESHADTYNRRAFIHWATIEGECNAREVVLIRDGENVQTDAKCASISGTWYSPYDGGVWTDPQDLDIDHMVPLKQAWVSGAWSWDSAKRKAFANSLEDSQLWAVTDNVNQSKADKDPSVWRPPLDSFWCEYAKSWVDVKHDWGLSAQRAEVEALAEMLATC